MRVHLADVEATESLARRFLRCLPADVAGWTVLLEGELGAGKSTFARALIKALGHTGAVPSPTYTLVEPYQLAEKIIYHIDLYRLSGEEELNDLGWTDLDDGLKLIEWPGRVPSLARAADVEVALNYAGSGRDARIRGLSGRGTALLEMLERQSDS
jgi:tRNA threonylcarbamoyladenosine biosynthesis protein TsaE